MDERFDVVVVGVGGMGSAACYHLARRGVRVLGLEQFDVPHARGSSHGFSRMIRTAYYEHADYVPLLKRSFELWKRLEEETLSPAKILHLTGGLYLGRRDGEIVAGSLRSCERHGLSYELFSRSELLGHYPQFHVPDDYVALFEYNAGFVVPELAVSAHAHLAMRHGAEIHGHEPVLSWESSGAGATVTTAKETYSCDQIVFCGGAWTDKLVRDLGFELRVTRQVMAWVQPNRRDYFLLGVLPVWAVDPGPEGGGGLYYGFPLLPDNPGLKLAYHKPGEAADPDRLDREPRAEDEQTVRPALRSFLPDADGPIVALRTCMYTNSPDHHFVVARHPTAERVTVACGFSGHGFKFCPVIGEALADLAVKGVSELPIGFLSPARLR
jgi:sarcosine oxidase